MKLSAAIVEYTGLGENSRKTLAGEIKPLDVHRNIIISNWQYVYLHFVDPDLRVKINFRKEKTTESGGIDFKIVKIDTSAN